MDKPTPQSTRALVIAPHPDDEVLGCGGTIAKFARRGIRVAVCIATEAYEPEWTKKFIAARPKEIARAHAALGVKKTFFLGLPTVKLDTLPQKDISAKIRQVIEEFRPDTLFIPHRGDLHYDHRLLHESALVAARPLAGNPVRTILAYETLSETEWGVEPFVPQLYEDISGTLPIKQKAMRAYSTEMRPFPHPRSAEAMEALAKKRGSEAGLLAAEAFVVVRSIR